jgi:hypothetical protein
VTRRDFRGVDHLFGTCPDCAELGDNLDRTVAAELLDLPPDAAVLDGLRIERFADRADHDPGKPNRAPWAHVNRRALTTAAERATEALARRQGGPCWVCGATLTAKGTQWGSCLMVDSGSWSTRRAAPAGPCTVASLSAARAPAGWQGRPTRRTACVSSPRTCFLGLCSVNERPYGPSDVPDRIGLALWADSGRTKGTTAPWAWAVRDLDERVATALPGRGVDVTRWTAILRVRHV